MMGVCWLKTDRPPRIEGGHPWVFDSEVARVEGAAPGDVVDVRDGGGRRIGAGFYNPHSRIRVRIAERTVAAIDASWFETKLSAALDRRRRFLPGEDAYRLCHAEADGLPGLVIDRMGDVLVVEPLILSMEQRLPWIEAALKKLLAPRGILKRGDVPVRTKEGLSLEVAVLAGDVPDEVKVDEAGIVYSVDPFAGQKTGHFFDQRPARVQLGKLTGGARVLDCFCHTGGFALHAAKGGATSVLAVDSSAAALVSLKRNALLNDVDVEARCANVFDELRRLEAAHEQFDVIVLDPPAFAKSRSALDGAYRGYKEINLRAMKMLAPGGILVTCSCSQVVNEEMFGMMLLDAARDARVEVRVLHRFGAGPDHPSLLASEQTRYLKSWFCQVDRLTNG